nr:MAG TPA: ExsB [Caudoviricetes sp.]
MVWSKPCGSCWTCSIYLREFDYGEPPCILHRSKRFGQPSFHSSMHLLRSHNLTYANDKRNTGI